MYEIPSTPGSKLVVEYNLIDESNIFTFLKKNDKSKKLQPVSKNLIKDNNNRLLLSKNLKNSNNSKLISDNIGVVHRQKNIDIINVPISRKNPIYPKRARLLNIEGTVIVLYNINVHGRIENIRILYSAPPRIFDNNVRLAMLSWVYESNKPKTNLKIVFKFNLYNDIKILRK